ISGGGATLKTITSASKQKLSATAATGVSIKAGRDMGLGGGGINIFGGNHVGSGASVLASQSGAKATAVAHTDGGVTAADAVSCTGGFVHLAGGSDVAGAHENSHFGGGGGFGHFSATVSWGPLTQVRAGGQKAAASLTATGNVSLTAGAGGITLDA